VANISYFNSLVTGSSQKKVNRYYVVMRALLKPVSGGFNNQLKLVYAQHRKRQSSLQEDALTIAPPKVKYSI
jgi:hypothetical protein